MHFRGLWVVPSWVFLGALPFFCFACSDDPSGSDAEETQEACNALVNDGPEVRYTAQTGTPPTPIGGTIADGMYELTALNLYGVTSAPNSIARAVFEITGTTMQQVGELDGDETRYTSTYSISGTTLFIRDSCPEASTDDPEFTATPTSLSYFVVSEGRTFELVLTKR